jgi:DNA-binding SARP family transcriptional activator
VVVDGARAPLGGAKARSLLALLLVHRGVGGLSRDQLIDALWGERPPKTVDAELRVYVAKLRKRLPEGVLVRRPDGYALQVRPEQLDAERFQQGARRGSALLAAGDIESAARTLAGALALWRGAPLADLAYEPWAQSEAQRLEELRLTALEERLAAELALGRHADVIAELAHLTAEHPYRERLHAQLMLARYRCGRQAEALETYRLLRRVLRDELGLDPSPELQRLERRILAQDPELVLQRPRAPRPTAGRRPSLDAARDTPLEAREPVPFVGRERALDVLLGQLGEALDGRSQIAFIQGEAGSGKTAIMAEFARRAERTDANLVVAAGQCRPTTGVVDLYAPFRRALGMLIGDLHEAVATGLSAPDQERRLWAASPDALRTLIEHGPGLVESLVPAREVLARARPWAAHLGRQLEELVAITARDRSEDPLPPGRIRDECVLVVDRISRRRPLVVLLDDLQWTDRSTLDVLASLAQQRTGVRLMIVAAYRLEDGSVCDEIVHDVKRRRGGVVVDLDQEAAAEARAFVDALLDREPNDLREPFRSELTYRSEGHALFAVELIEELKATGDLRRDSEGRWTEPQRADWERWPPRIEGLLAGTFARLDEQTLDALRVGSVEGEDFSADVVAAVQGVSVDAVVGRLSGGATERQQIVRAIGAQRLAGARVFRYRFRHHLYQRFLYERLDDVRRAHLHERVASALEALGADAYEDLALTLAHHLQSAAIPERAIPYLDRAGRRAMRLSANQQAVEHFSRAIAVVRGLPEGEPRRRTEAELQLQLALALSALRGFSAPEVEHAYARSTQLTMASTPTEEQFPIHFGLWVFHVSRGNLDDSRRIVGRMMEVASRDGDEALRLQALHTRWPDSVIRGCIDDAVASASEGLSIYRPEAHHDLTFRYGNHDPGVCALAGLGLALAARGDAAGALERVHEAVDLSDTLGHSFTRAHARSLAAWAAQTIGDPAAALPEADRALALEADVDAPHFFAIARAARGWALCARDHDEGTADLEWALDTHQRVAAHPYAALTAALLAEALLRRDQPQAAEAVIRQMLSLSETVGIYFGTPEILRVEAHYLASHGREDQARRRLLDAISTARKQGSWALALRAALTLVRMASPDAKADVNMLAELYRRLPADNDFHDTQNARALLADAATR